MNVYVKIFRTQKAQDGNKNKCKYFQMSEFSGYIGQKSNEKSGMIRGRDSRQIRKSVATYSICPHAFMAKIFGENFLKFFGENFFEIFPLRSLFFYFIMYLC